jgi:hypothetical protein
MLQLHTDHDKLIIKFITNSELQPYKPLKCLQLATQSMYKLIF